MTVSPFPHDPWGRCLCPPSRLPGPTDPRLCAFVDSRLTRSGGVVNLSAALWGGDWRRQVPLSTEQAVALAHELVGHAARLRVEHDFGRGSASAGPRGRRRNRLQPDSEAPPIRPARAVDSAS